MKQQINEIKRMQQLAGLIKESQLNEDENQDEIVRKLAKYVTNPDLYKNSFTEWEDQLFSDDEDNNYNNFDYFVRNWTVLDDEQSRHEDEVNKDIEYWMQEYDVNENIANLMKQLVDSYID